MSNRFGISEDTCMPQWLSFIRRRGLSRFKKKINGNSGDEDKDGPPAKGCGTCL